MDSRANQFALYSRGLPEAPCSTILPVLFRKPASLLLIAEAPVTGEKEHPCQFQLLTRIDSVALLFARGEVHVRSNRGIALVIVRGA